MPDAATLAAAHAGGHPSPAEIILILILAAVAYGAAYSVSVRRHPYRACSKCEGAGKHRGTVFTDSFRACTRCGGTGRQLRTFARTPDPGRPRAFEPGADAAARRAARREQKRGH
jgi:hypothetical protein